MARDYRRKQFFIKKEFQWKFILLYVLVISAIAGTATAWLYVQTDGILQHYLFSSHLKIDRSGQILYESLLTTNLAAIAAIAVGTILLSLYIFRRLNLHFSSMEQRIDALSRGDFSLPSQPASHFNQISELIELIQVTQQEQQETYRALSATLDTLEQGILNGGDQATLLAANAELKNMLKQIQLPA